MPTSTNDNGNPYNDKPTDEDEYDSAGCNNNGYNNAGRDDDALGYNNINPDDVVLVDEDEPTVNYDEDEYPWDELSYNDIDNNYDAGSDDDEYDNIT